MGESENMNVTVDTMKLREEFIRNLNRTTMTDVVFYSSQFPLLTFVAISFELLILNKFDMIAFKISPKNLVNALFVYSLETLTIVLPLTLWFSVLSDYIHILFLSLIGFITIIVVASVSRVDDHVLYWKFTDLRHILLSEIIKSKKQPYITYFRSFVLLITAVAILGVDFQIFPRRFAKTETYGVSLMDLGVGMFVISSALVEKRSLSTTALKKTFVSSCVLLFLGIMRCLLVQRLDYQMHVTEYGRDWNFFFTLAFVKMISSLILILFRGHGLVSGLVLTIIHQYLLSRSLESLVLSNEERVDWFNANREGIISLSGYVSIHLIGITIANFANPIDKHHLTKNKLKAILVFSVISAFLFCTVWYLDSLGLKVSRRLANLPYVLWVTAVCLKLLVLFLFVEFMSCWLLPIDPKLKNNHYNIVMPVLLESINFNGLLYFLLSNFITGVINIYIDAFSVGSLMSTLILLSYMVVNCAVVFILYIFNIQLKL